MTKRTKREFYEAIATAMTIGTIPEFANEITDFCNREIEALERKAAKAKENAAKKRAEGDEMRAAIENTLTAEPQIIADISAALAENFPEITPAKVSTRLNQLVKAGIAEKESVSVEINGKKCQRMAYKIV